MQLYCPDIRVVTIVPRVTTCHHSLLLPLDAGCPRPGLSGLPVRAVNGTNTVLGEPGTSSMLKKAFFCFNNIKILLRHYAIHCIDIMIYTILQWPFKHGEYIGTIVRKDQQAV